MYIYNKKSESMKDYKFFFYKYSEFNAFTRQSSVENCYKLHFKYKLQITI